MRTNKTGEGCYARLRPDATTEPGIVWGNPLHTDLFEGQGAGSTPSKRLMTDSVRAVGRVLSAPIENWRRRASALTLASEICEAAIKQTKLQTGASSDAWTRLVKHCAAHQLSLSEILEKPREMGKPAALQLLLNEEAVNELAIVLSALPDGQLLQGRVRISGTSSDGTIGKYRFLSQLNAANQFNGCMVSIDAETGEFKHHWRYLKGEMKASHAMPAQAKTEVPALQATDDSDKGLLDKQRDRIAALEQRLDALEGVRRSPVLPEI